jgi:hypothetical protein
MEDSRRAPNPSFVKERVIKEDGRYLIYYRFRRASPDKDEEETGERAAGDAAEGDARPARDAGAA